MIKQNSGDFEFLAVVCNTGANAGTDVETQNLQPQSPRLPEDLSVSEVAANGGPARYALVPHCLYKYALRGSGDEGPVQWPVSTLQVRLLSNCPVPLPTQPGLTCHDLL